MRMAFANPPWLSLRIKPAIARAATIAVVVTAPAGMIAVDDLLAAGHGGQQPVTARRGRVAAEDLVAADRQAGHAGARRVVGGHGTEPAAQHTVDDGGQGGAGREERRDAADEVLRSDRCCAALDS